MTEREGRFITFEGCDGSGKSTQAARLTDTLRAAGHEVVATREPGGSPRAEAIRELLLSGKAAKFGAFAETVLFNAARADHLRVTILPALRRGAIVVCDRFADSTRAYQGALGQVDEALVLAAEHAVVADAMPDLTIILDLPAEMTMARLKKRRSPSGTDKFEAEALAHHARLRRSFLDIAAAAPQRCVVVSARRSIEQVAQRIWRVVETRLGAPDDGEPARRKVGDGHDDKPGR